MRAESDLRDLARGPAVWRGVDQRRQDWLVELDAADCNELIGVAQSLRGRPLDEISAVDFPVIQLAPKLQQAAQRLDTGPGFVLLRGLPVADIERDLLEIIYWGIGAQLGVGVSQSAAGDRLGQVFDRGRPENERYYTRGGPLEFHLDPVDVVGLLCLRTAISGGASRIVSAGEVHNIIRAERPDLLELLYRGFHNSRRAHGEATPTARVPVFDTGQHGTECYLLPTTIRQAVDEGYPVSAADQEALDLIDEVANRPGVFLDMDFRVGDIQFLSNRTILHSRTDYEDDPDPARKRYLLRLWLMVPSWAPRPAAMNFHDLVDKAGGGVRPSSAR